MTATFVHLARLVIVDLRPAGSDRRGAGMDAADGPSATAEDIMPAAALFIRTPQLVN